ncbi:MAG TPA: lysylphosphatidylglycerol synthase transmembrane domain-containing protein, partial [Acidimicrobiales bacterium]
RAGIAALEGKEPPQPLSPTRVAATNLVPVVGVAAAVYFLLPRLARSSLSLHTVQRAQWPWLLGVAGGAVLTYVIATVVLMAAAGRRLPFGRTFAVQLAAASTNRVVPAGLGAAATNIRYLELAGLERPEAVTAIGLIAGSGFVVHTLGTIVAVTLLRSRAVTLHVPDLDRTWPALLALGLACAVVGWVVWARKLHVALLRWVRVARGSVTAVAAHPGRVAVLVAGSVGISAGYVLALAASLAAFGVRPGLGTVAGVYLASSAVAALAPTPGGVGPFEAAAVAGMGTLGVAAGPAVAAVLTYRLITYWLPVVPGGIALHVLRRKGDL